MTCSGQSREQESQSLATADVNVRACSRQTRTAHPHRRNAAEGNRLVTPLLDVIVVCVSAAFPYQRKCLR